jgi:hypothetical protein
MLDVHSMFCYAHLLCGGKTAKFVFVPVYPEVAEEELRPAELGTELH